MTSHVVTSGDGIVVCMDSRDSHSVRLCQRALPRRISALILETSVSSLESTISGAEKDNLSHHPSLMEVSPENITFPLF